MLDFIDVAFLTDRVIPSLNMGLEVSLKLIIPAALIGGALGVFTGVVRVFGPRWARRLADAVVAGVGAPVTVAEMAGEAEAAETSAVEAPAAAEAPAAPEAAEAPAAAAE